MTRDRRDPCAISLDRIDSTGDYTCDNIQLVCRAINLAKNTYQNSEIIRLMSLIRATPQISAD